MRPKSGCSDPEPTDQIPLADRIFAWSACLETGMAPSSTVHAESDKRAPTAPAGKTFAAWMHLIWPGAQKKPGRSCPSVASLTEELFGARDGGRELMQVIPWNSACNPILLGVIAFYLKK